MDRHGFRRFDLLAKNIEKKSFINYKIKDFSLYFFFLV